MTAELNANIHTVLGPTYFWLDCQLVYMAQTKNDEITRSCNPFASNFVFSLYGTPIHLSDSHR